MGVLLMVQLYFALPSIKVLHINSNLYRPPIAFIYLRAFVVSKYLFVTHKQRSFTCLFTVL